MNKIKLIALQLTNLKYIILNAETGHVIINNVTKDWLDTNSIHKCIKETCGNFPWELTYINLQNWNR